MPRSIRSSLVVAALLGAALTGCAADARRFRYGHYYDEDRWLLVPPPRIRVPDLRPRRSSSYVQDRDDVFIEVTVRNQGEIYSDSFLVTAEVDDPGTLAGFLPARLPQTFPFAARCPRLDPNYEFVVRFGPLDIPESSRPMQGVQLDIEVIVDPAIPGRARGEIIESNEGNNRRNDPEIIY